MANDGVEAGATPESAVTEPLAETGASAGAELQVDGLHCRSCAALVEETRRGDPGVHTATVELGTARGSVTFDIGTARGSVTFDIAARSVDDLCATATGLGYRATPLPSGDGAR